MDQSALYAYIGSLTNDPNHDRYTTAIIDTELDAVQAKWNVAANIIKTSETLTTVSGTASYAITTYPVKFLRATHKNIDLKKRDKAWFDLYSASDWTDDTGTPTDFYIDDITSATVAYIVVYPIPQGDDAGANLAVEYLVPHTAMSATTDLPWNGMSAMTPYHYGFAKEVAGNLLARDPSTENTQRAAKLLSDSNKTLQDAIHYFEALSEEEPPRMRGGRYYR